MVDDSQIYTNEFRNQVSAKNIHRNNSIQSGISKKLKLVEQNNDAIQYIVDAIMFCSSSDNDQIRSLAFSTLSSLSEYSSNDRTIMAQIKRDTKILDTSEDYLKFIKERIELAKESFVSEFRTENIEQTNPGIFSLIQIAYGTCHSDIENAINTYVQYMKQLEAVEEPMKDQRVSDMTVDILKLQPVQIIDKNTVLHTEEDELFFRDENDDEKL